MNVMGRRLRALLALLLLMCGAGRAAAHEMTMAEMELRETVRGDCASTALASATRR
jgi:hypothetical protein